MGHKESDTTEHQWVYVYESIIMPAHFYLCLSIWKMKFTVVAPVLISTTASFLVFSLCVYCPSPSARKTCSVLLDPTPVCNHPCSCCHFSLLHPVGGFLTPPGLQHPAWSLRPAHHALYTLSQSPASRGRPFPPPLGGHHPPHSAQTSSSPARCPAPQMESFFPHLWLQLHEQGHLLNSLWTHSLRRTSFHSTPNL